MPKFIIALVNHQHDITYASVLAMFKGTRIMKKMVDATSIRAIREFMKAPDYVKNKFQDTFDYRIDPGYTVLDT